ncbi:MAG TPA: hypothetical protein VMV89_10745 [Candidatus Paceibacterota bacterium]|nr:hypothetical protein [Candidatus Paceibacterota bacterium]
MNLVHPDRMDVVQLPVGQLSHPNLDESGGLDANGIAVEHERHGAIHRYSRDEFRHAVLSGGNAVVNVPAIRAFIV